MKQIITIQHTQSIHHTNGMVGSWTDWDLSESGIEQAERIGQKLAKQLSGHKMLCMLPIFCEQSTPLKLSQSIWESHLTLERNFESAI